MTQDSDCMSLEDIPRLWEFPLSGLARNTAFLNVMNLTTHCGKASLGMLSITSSSISRRSFAVVQALSEGIRTWDSPNAMHSAGPGKQPLIKTNLRGPFYGSKLQSHGNVENVHRTGALTDALKRASCGLSVAQDVSTLQCYTHF